LPLLVRIAIAFPLQGRRPGPGLADGARKANRHRSAIVDRDFTSFMRGTAGRRRGATPLDGTVTDVRIHNVKLSFLLG